MKDIKQYMKAARLHKIGDFCVDELPVPVPKGEELLVKMGACGVCGSDLPRIYEHGSSNGKYPLTVGHEFAGTIVAVGGDADPRLVGKRGAFYPLIPCRKCPSCLAGHYAMCEDYDYMGSRRDGGFAEYCLVPSSWHFVESHNPELSFETLAMAEPACVAQHAAIRKSPVFPGAHMLIFGAGPIGIMAARWARLAGANVLMVDVAEDKVELAEKKGFAAVNSAKVEMVSAVKAAFGGALADIAVEGTGCGSALENAIHCIKPFGSITLLGNPAGNTQISQKAHSLLLRREVTIRGIWNSHFSDMPINEWRYTVDMMDSGAFQCEDLVSHRCSLDEIPGVIDDIRNRRISSCKVLYLAEKD